MVNRTGNQTDLSVREYNDGDKTGVFELRESVYGSSFGESQWNWKYIDPSSARRSKIFVAESHGKIVGLRPIVLMALFVKNQSVVAGMCMDAMVHQDFRQRGIYTKLLHEAITSVRKQGINVIVTFPNERSCPIILKSDTMWHHVCSVPLMVKPIEFTGLAKKYIKFAPLQKPVGFLGKCIYGSIKSNISTCKSGRDHTIKQVDCFDTRFDGLWQKSPHKNKVSIVRNSQYLKWRYGENPITGYVILADEKDDELKGYIVLKTAPNMFGLNLGLIVDMLTLEEEQVVNNLLSQAVSYFRSQKVDTVGCIMLKDSVYYQNLKDHGFISLPKLLSPKEFFFLVNANSFDESTTIALDRKNWYLTFGDIDIV